MTQEIYAVAAALWGNPSEGEANCLLALCGAAEAEWEARLKAGMTKENCRDAFLCAAAWTALAGMSAARQEEVAAFSAGDIRVERRSGQDRERWRDTLCQAERIMAPYCGDAAFVFEGVPGE